MGINGQKNSSGRIAGLATQFRFAALLALCAIFILPAGVRAWTQIGPWGGVIHDLAQHSAVSNTIFAGTAEGLYLYDGTFPWQVITGTESMRVIKVVPDPARSALYFISPSDPLDFSFDDEDPQGSLYKVNLNSGALSVLISGNVSDVVVAGDGDVVAAVNTTSGMIYRFENGSSVASTININPADPLQIYALHASPGADTVFAARNLSNYRSNVFVSDDTGLTWSSDYSEADTSGSALNSNFITMGQDSSGAPLIGTHDGRVLSRASGSWNQHGLVSADACSPDGLPPYNIIKFANDSSGQTFALLREHDWDFWSPNCGPQGFFQMPASANTSWPRYTGYDGVSSRVSDMETTPGYDWVAFDDAGVRRTASGSGGPGVDADAGIVSNIRLSGITVDPRSDDRCIAFGSPGMKEGQFWASGIYEHRGGTWKRLVLDQFITPANSGNQQVIRESGFLSGSISSEDPSIIWIGGNDSGLLRGEQISAGSWTYNWDRKYLRGTNPGDFVYDVIVDPFDSDTVWWATGRGIHITTTDGLTRTQLTTDLDVRDLDMELLESSQRKYIAGMQHFGGPSQPGLLTSDDGITWTPLLFDGLSIHATAFQPLPWVTDIRALAGPSIDLSQGVGFGSSTSWYVDSSFYNPTGFPNNPVFQNIDTPLGWDRDRLADAYAVVWRNDLTTVRGLYHSEAASLDGVPGLTWTDIAASVPYAPAGVAVDSKDGGLLWMATVGGGVYTLHTGNFQDITIPSFPIGSSLEVTDSSLVNEVISLSWTAPGDDGDLPGWADRYELYYRNDHPINSPADFSGAFTVSVERPQISHHVENLTIDIGPTPKGKYNFAIRAIDEQGLPSILQAATAILFNDLPFAVDDFYTIDEDVTSQLSVMVNDGDIDSDPIDIQSSDHGSHGTVVDNQDGTLNYTPDAGYFGTDSFSYTIVDPYGGTAVATVYMTVDPVNDDPVANNDAGNTNEEVAITLDVLVNDTDEEGNSLSVTGVTDGSNGSTVNNGDGTVTFTPVTDYYGSDSFTYTISDGNGGSDGATVNITVANVQDAPVASADSATTTEDTGVIISVIANDSDPDPDTLALFGVLPASHGAVVDNGNDTVTYSPQADYFGTDSFSYIVSDGNGGTDSASVSVTISPENDAPVAVDDVMTADEDSSGIYSVLDNDTDVDGDTLIVSAVTHGTSGSVTNNGNGTVTYTPIPGYVGTDSFTYTANDSNGGTDIASVSVTVNNVNDAPSASADAATTPEDSAVTIDVLANDSDIENDTLTIAAVTQGSNGSVKVNTDDTLTYDPGTDYFGTDSFTYTASDGNGGTDTASVSITVNSVNDIPTCTDDNATVVAGQSITIDILLNDYDKESPILTNVSAPVFSTPIGVVVVNSDNTLGYTASTSTGDDEFFYRAEDGDADACFGGGAAVTVKVIASDNLPHATRDDVTMDEGDPPIDIDVLANDYDLDGHGTLSVVSIGTPSDGNAVLNVDDTVTYTPDIDFFRQDSLMYTITDGSNSDTGTAYIWVNNINDPPDAVDDSQTTDEDTAANISVLTNDSDADNETPTVLAVTQGSHGTVVIEVDDTITYTPVSDYFGTDSFTYTAGDGNGGTDTANVAVTVSPVPDAPVAVDDVMTVNEDSARAYSVLDNDSDVDGESLIVSAVTHGTQGSVVNNGNGTVTYTPLAGYVGTDSFTYTASDGSLTDDGAVNVTVINVNDAPSAIADTATTSEDSSVTIDVLANDSDIEGDTLTVTGATQGGNGSVILNVDDTLTYTPVPDYYGTDTFTYIVGDGNGGTGSADVSITVTALNDPPDAQNDSVTTNEDTAVIVTVLTNDSDPETDTLTIDSFSQGTNGTVVDNGNQTLTFTPQSDYYGTDSFTYTVTDGSDTDTATVNITVLPIGDDPVAVDDTANTDEDSSATIDAVANDSDPDSDTVTLRTVGQATNGTAVANSAGTITYTPLADYNGTDSFTYTAADGQGGIANGTVTVTINPMNDNPVAVDDSTSLTSGQLIDIDVVSNDTDIDLDSLAIQLPLDLSGTSGLATRKNSTTITYQAPAGYTGTDSLQYTVTDGAGGQDTALVTLTVNAPSQGGGGGGGGGCFIATAAFGSPMEPELYILRAYRDGYLKDRAWGRALLSLYYRFSPGLAEIIARDPVLRSASRALLLPIIISLQNVNTFTALPAMVGLALVLMPIIVVIWAARWLLLSVRRRRIISET